MTPKMPSGERFLQVLDQQRPLQIAGVINAICAKLAERSGFGCLYLSGAGVANASFGLPDLGMTQLEDVLIDARRITAACDVPLLVDCDTGWETTATIPVTVRRMIDAGVAAIHLEDQAEPKRCGHRPGKRLVSTSRMCQRIQQAVDSRGDDSLLIMARTDAAADEGLTSAIQRSEQYVSAGADLIFAEALVSEDQFRDFASEVSVPVLANMTEFGRSPMLTSGQLGNAGIRMVLYPLSAFRAMNASAERVYRTLRATGVQSDLIGSMQTREELYDLLDYHEYEKKLDQAAKESEGASDER